MGNIYAEAALALQPPDLVEVTRDGLDERGIKTQGFVVGLSDEFLLLNALGQYKPYVDQYRKGIPCK